MSSFTVDLKDGYGSSILTTSDVKVSDIKFDHRRKVDIKIVPRSDFSIIDFDKLQPIRISLEGTVVGSCWDSMRKHWTDYKNRLNSGSLYLYLDSDRYVEAICGNYAESFQGIDTFMRFNMSLTGKNPYFQDVSTTVYSTTPIGTTQFLVHNAGDVCVPCRIEMANTTSYINNNLKLENLSNSTVFEYKGNLGIPMTFDVDKGVKTYQNYSLKIDAVNITTAPAYLGTALLFLQGNGVDGSTSILDSSASGHSVVSSGVEIDTAQKMYGSGSLLFDNSYLTIPDSDDFNLASGDFTLEFFMRPTSIDVEQFIYLQHSAAGANQIYARILSSNVLQIQGITSSTSVGEFQTSSPLPILTDNWYHLAVVRNGTNPYVFLNGNSLPIVIGTALATFPNISSPLYLGKDTISNTTPLYAHMDDFRLIKSALYTASFDMTSIWFTSTVLAQRDFTDFEGDLISVESGTNIFRLTSEAGTSVKISYRKMYG